jgi:hypothetical protein
MKIIFGYSLVIIVLTVLIILHFCTKGALPVLSTTVTFEYGNTEGYGQTVTGHQSPVTGITNVYVILSGLTAGTTYHYRIKTVNPLGTNYGEDVTFQTVGQTPTALT